ncbi:MAG TPA: FtsX-like permease family protein [Anaeromyxobacteraceae bacterium]|nr:FtsX-like permease family protein [Anaeromyxobacteraceae bacterium]
MLLVDLQMAGRNLRRHARRNLFLGGALGAVTGLLALLNGLTSGMEAAMMESAHTLLTGHVNVGGFFKVTSGSAAPLVSDYPKALATVKEKVPELDFFTSRVRGWSKGVSETASMDLVLGGIDVDHEPALPRVLRFIEGDLSALRQPGTLLLFQAQAKRLKVKVGDVVTISAPTARGVNNTADVRVAAVARDVGLLSSFSAFIEASTLRGLYGLNDTTTGALHLYLKDEEDAAAVASRLRAALAESGWRVMEPSAQPYWMKLMFSVPAEDWTGQKIDVTTADEEMDQFKWFVLALRAVSWVLTTILLLVVLIGILNTMAIAVRERTKEIGTLRAIGMQRRKVLWLFVLETSMLSVLGTAAGAVVAAGVALALNAAAIVLPPAVQIFLAMEHLRLLVRPAWLVAYVVGISAATVLASLYPARRAARLRPVTAMHHIG